MGVFLRMPPATDRGTLIGASTSYEPVFSIYTIVQKYDTFPHFPNCFSKKMKKCNFKPKTTVFSLPYLKNTL